MGYVERHLLPNEQVIYKTKPPLDPLREARARDASGSRPHRDPGRPRSRGVALVPGPPCDRRRPGLGRDPRRGAPDLGVRRDHDPAHLQGGVVGRYTMELLLGKVESIGVQQTLVGRVLNYGDLVVTGTGGARGGVHGRVRDPIGFRNHVQQASLRALEPERGQARLAMAMDDDLEIEDEPRPEEVAALDDQPLPPQRGGDRLRRRPVAGDLRSRRAPASSWLASMDGRGVGRAS